MLPATRRRNKYKSTHELQAKVTTRVIRLTNCSHCLVGTAPQRLHTDCRGQNCSPQSSQNNADSPWDDPLLSFYPRRMRLSRLPRRPRIEYAHIREGHPLKNPANRTPELPDSLRASTSVDEVLPSLHPWRESGELLKRGFTECQSSPALPRAIDFYLSPCLRWSGQFEMQVLNRHCVHPCYLLLGSEGTARQEPCKAGANTI